MPGTKVVILAGGRGTRLSEETHAIPKPMVRLAGRPMLWHIMSLYARAGYTDFVVACGYKGYVIKEYFTNYFRHESDLRVDLATGQTQVLAPATSADWTVTLADTGIDSMTGGRLKRLAPLLDERFLLTYGDGLSDVPIEEVVRHHEQQDALATMTAVSPPPRFGALDVQDGMVRRFREKPDDRARINGGFFVVEPEVLDLIEGDSTVFEQGPLSGLAQQGRLAAYEHDGFWMPMDTARERDDLDALAQSDTPPWVRP